MKTFMRHTRCVCNSCFHGDRLWFPNTHLTCNISSETVFQLGKRTWVVIKTALWGESLVGLRQPACAKFRCCSSVRSPRRTELNLVAAHQVWHTCPTFATLLGSVDLQMHSEKPNQRTRLFTTVSSFWLRVFPVLNRRKRWNPLCFVLKHFS